MKDQNPKLIIGFVGAKVAVKPEESLKGAPALDFVARNEFDFTCLEVAEGREFKDVDGISYRNEAGEIVHNKDREILEDMDQLPFVTDVYKRDLQIEDYFIGYLKHPYISIYTGRGCKSRCTFCLWPQTVGGHRYRVRSPEHVAAEIKQAMQDFPQVKEFFFDDDTFTDNLPRAEAIAKRAWQAGRHLVVQCQGQRALRDAEGAEGKRPAPAAGRLRIRQPADPAQHQEGLADRGRRRSSPRIATTSASRSTAPSSWACRAKRPRRSSETMALCEGDQPAHDPGLAGCALSRHVPL